MNPIVKTIALMTAIIILAVAANALFSILLSFFSITLDPTWIASEILGFFTIETIEAFWGVMLGFLTFVWTAFMEFLGMIF